MRALPVAVAVAVLGFTAIWLGVTPLPGGSVAAAPCAWRDAAEGSSLRFEPSWRPPGATRCVVTAPDGAMTTGVHVPWAEWVALLLGAAAAGLAAAARSARARRVRRLAAAAVLALAGLVAPFLSAGARALLVAAAAMLVALVLLPRGGPHPAPGLP